MSNNFKKFLKNFLPIEKSKEKCYNNNMGNGLKKIDLYGGKSVFLEMILDDDTSYIIRAYSGLDVVGVCYFDIEKFYQRKLSHDERLANAPFFGGIEKTPKTCEILTTKKDKDKYIIKDNLLLFKSRGKWHYFPLQWAKCELELIEIKHKDFFKTGLGTAMLKTMEEFILQDGCTQIYAHFQPIGAFAKGSRKFYERNGFSIEHDPCDQKDYATKFLSKSTLATKNNSSGIKTKQ